MASAESVKQKTERLEINDKSESRIIPTESHG
jgi:hypothetical protein